MEEKPTIMPQMPFIAERCSCQSGNRETQHRLTHKVTLAAHARRGLINYVSTVPLNSLILYASQKRGSVMQLHCWSVLYKGTIVYNKTDIVVVEE